MPFLLPPELGGVLEHPQVVQMGKTTVGMMIQMQNIGMDEGIQGMVEEEWDRLCKDWGTKRVWAIQTMLLLEDEG